MRKLVKIEDLYTEAFDNQPIKFITNPFVECARELVKDTNKEVTDTKYYRLLTEMLAEHGIIWGSIFSDEDVIARVEKFRELVISLKENGYLRSLEPRAVWFNGKRYGSLTGEEKEYGTCLIDGHHRISILHVLGVKEIKILI